MVEGVILLPVMGLLLLCVLFANQKYRERSRAVSRARLCATTQAITGCDAPPAEACAQPPAAGSLGDAGGAALWDLAADDAGDLDIAVLPGLDEAIDALFGQTVQVEVPWAVRIPFGGGRELQAAAEQTLACGQMPKTFEDVAHATMCSVLPPPACIGE